ncbi:MAG: porin [Ahrensia sp.]|nr:porin [Ahrensia sp.]
MKLKALLLGSAAAMMSVTGFSAANAADAVIAEPEPVEYVRVCDMYGAKWFYLPGTETCIQFDGYVRVTYEYNDPDQPTVNPDGSSQSSSANFGYRARLNVRTRNETDYGTLEGWIRFQGNSNSPSDATVGVDRALISLAGFRLGYSDSYVTTHHGYGLYSDRQDGIYDYHQATFFDYTYSSNGFSGTIGTQLSGGSLGLAHDARSLDYYIGVGYSGSWGGIALSAIHDNERDAEAYKISVDLNLIENLSVRGWYHFDDGDSKYVTGSYGPFFAGSTLIDQQWGIGMQYKFNDMFAFRAGYTAADSDVAGLDTDYVAVGLDIRPVPGLIIRPEAAFADEGEQYSVRVYRTF